MALLEVNFYSKVLEKQTTMKLILPEYPVGGKPLSKTPVLTLLHGLSDNYTGWTRRTNIERYAEKYGIAVVMPDSGRGFYANMARGYRYWDHVSAEVPAIVRRLFGLSDKRVLNHVAGLSMGGFGAMKHAVLQPQRFATAASFSGALDLTAIDPEESGHFALGEGELLFGTRQALVDSENDLLAQLRRDVAEGVVLPRLFVWCGTEDELYPLNLSFRAECEKLGVPLAYHEGPGNHRWEHWDEWILKYLQWLMDEKLL